MRKKTVMGSFITILVIAVFIWIVKIVHGDMPYVDQWTRGFVEIVAGTPFYTFFRWMTELGSKSFVLPFTVVMMIVLWIVRKNYIPALFFGFGTLGSHLANKTIKSFVTRERPSISVLLNAEGYSFPSGHAMVSIVCYGLLAYFIGEMASSKKATYSIYAFFIMLILLIGVSRYMINVHYITDIAAGFLFGYLFLIVVIYVYKKVARWRNESN